MNKKGISPLIATVLLIGFVVAIGGVVMFWGKDFITERTEKEGSLSKAKLDCTSINLKIISASGGEVIVENRGSVTIHGFMIKYYGGANDGELESMYNEVKTMGRLVISTDADSVDVIPATKPEGIGAPLVPCSDKHKLVNLR